MWRVLGLGVGLAACGGSTVSGTLTHGLTGRPVAGSGVSLAAVSEVSVPCQTLHTLTGPDGTWSVSGACLGRTAYRVTLDDPALWLADGAEVSGPGAHLVGYPSPVAGGVALLGAGGLAVLPAHADVREETAWRSDAVVRFPSALPSEADIPRVGPGDFLVISGDAAVDIVPLIHSEARKFGDDVQFSLMQPWWYLGVVFDSDTVFERRSVALDLAHVVQKSSGGRAARYLDADALPAGRYALLTADRRRLSVVDFGTAEDTP